MKERSITIEYRRLPDRVQHFEQLEIERTPEYIVTWLEAARLERPVRAGEALILEPGAPVIWFTYPGLWHDIGRFHLRNGSFTGYYANVLTPVEMEGRRWRTTDLCLDLWCGVDGSLAILDEDDFETALTRGWLTEAVARRAREEIEELARAARAGSWPPPEVRRWTLGRVREELESGRGTPG